MRANRGVVVALAFGLGLAVSSVGLAAGEEVDLCHFPPGNPENAQVVTVGEKAAEAHLAKHADWPVLAFNVNFVGCAFCAEPSDECGVFCVGTPPCLCPPDDLAACCEANPCCDPCPEPKPEECSLIHCGSDPPECSVTVCSGSDD